MKHKFACASLALALFLVGATLLWAQYQPHFTPLFSPTISSDHKTYYITGGISGTATMVQQPPPGTTHQASSLVRNLSSGGSSSNTGSPVCPTCFTQSTATLNEDVCSPDGSDGLPICQFPVFDVEVTSSVVCSVLHGSFFNSDNKYHAEHAKSMSKVIAASGNGATLQAYCTDATSPPDYNPTYATFAVAPHVGDYSDNQGLCWRKGTTGSWTCVGTSIYLGGANDPPPAKMTCTHNP